MTQFNMRGFMFLFFLLLRQSQITTSMKKSSAWGPRQSPTFAYWSCLVTQREGLDLNPGLHLSAHVLPVQDAGFSPGIHAYSKGYLCVHVGVIVCPTQTGNLSRVSPAFAQQ